MDHGLRYVYTGNVRNAEGDTTFCPRCQTALIERDWHRIANYRLTPAGACPHCSTAVAGRFAAQAGNFGRRRIPIAIGA
jgi:pyruvate formate lyase activating enzyme